MVNRKQGLELARMVRGRECRSYVEAALALADFVVQLEAETVLAETKWAEAEAATRHTTARNHVLELRNRAIVDLAEGRAGAVKVISRIVRPEVELSEEEGAG